MPSPIPAMGKNMLNVSIRKVKNQIKKDESMLISRLVNQQMFGFNEFCDYLASGSTVTPGDVFAVMKQMEKAIPVLLSLNTCITVTPDGLTIRPVIKGTLTQSELKEKLIQRKESFLQSGDTEAAGKIDTEREISVSDLQISDLKAVIGISIPKKWNVRLQEVAKMKRVSKDGGTEEGADNSPETSEDNNQDVTPGGNPSDGGTENENLPGAE